jgi:hypothetical protein
MIPCCKDGNVIASTLLAATRLVAYRISSKMISLVLLLYVAVGSGSGIV